jgi:hypothetical protein
MKLLKMIKCCNNAALSGLVGGSKALQVFDNYRIADMFL